MTQPKLKHFARVPFQAVCGADEANQSTTTIVSRVTCPACIRVERVDRALNPRDVPIGTRHSRANVDAWKKKAKETKISFVDWVEWKLNA